MAVHTCDLSTWEVDTGGSEVRGHPQLHRKAGDQPWIHEAPSEAKKEASEFAPPGFLWAWLDLLGLRSRCPPKFLNLKPSKKDGHVHVYVSVLSLVIPQEGNGLLFVEGRPPAMSHAWEEVAIPSVPGEVAFSSEQHLAGPEPSSHYFKCFPCTADVTDVTILPSVNCAHPHFPLDISEPFRGGGRRRRPRSVETLLRSSAAVGLLFTTKSETVLSFWQRRSRPASGHMVVGTYSWKSEASSSVFFFLKLKWGRYSNN